MVQKELGGQPIILDARSDPYASEFVFISSNYGIYTFDRNSEKWSRITTANGLPDNTIDIIGIDQGILWVNTPLGLASADVRINDWVIYESFGKIQGLAFDDEYVWVGGDFGLERFDKYIETWDHIVGLNINDMCSEKNYIWLAADSGIARYNREFEKLEKVLDAPQYAYYRIINTPDMLWFLAREKTVGYHKSNEQWSIYPSLVIDAYAAVNDSLFIVSAGQVILYEPKADHWVSFHDIEDLGMVNSIFVNGQDMLFATDNGLVVYTYTEKKRRSYNRANGLEFDSLICAYQDTKYIYTVGSQNIEYLDKTSDIWEIEQLLAPGKRPRKIFYIDEAGGHANIIKNIDMKLQGRTYYSETRDLSDAAATLSDYENVNLKLIWQHNSNRVLSSYYDDTDKEQKEFGFGYRGLPNDLLYRCNGGYLESEYFEFDLIPRYSTFGGNAKLRYKEQALDLQAGEMKSTLRNDFFTGRITDNATSILDINYRKNTFYYVYGTARMIAQNYDTIFVDDQNPLSNTIDTRTGYTVAGLSGDYDPLLNGIDYYLDYRSGIIHFLGQRSGSDIIIMKINNEEIIIQSNTVTDHELENIYFIGPDIIPNTLVMTITDTLSQIYALSDFGLDHDNDGLIDHEYIDHNLGYLMFPDPRPFPDEVYDDTLNVYTMNFSFRSQSTFYYLTYKPILKMSEKVYVDGELMTRASDYVVDYTSGILLFVKEELVSDFSEIEIQYASVERERDDLFYSAQPNFKINDNINIAPGFSFIDDKNIGHLSARLQYNPDEDINVKFIPQTAIDDEQNWAQKYEMLTTYKIISINAGYHAYSDSFEGFGLDEKKYGRLKQGGDLGINVEPVQFIRIQGKFKRDYLIDSLQEHRNTQHIQARLSYLNPKFINGYIQAARDELPDHEKDRLQVNGKYDLQILKTALKLNSIINHTRAKYANNDRKSLTEYILTANIALPFPLQGDVYFRHKDFYGRDLKEKKEQELRSALNMDIIPGVYYTGNYDLKTWTYFLDASQELALENYFYNNINIAPGRWIRSLSIINFSLGFGKSFNQYLRNLNRSYTRPYFIMDPLKDGTISSINNNNNYYLTLQLTPFAELLIWAKHTLTNSGLVYYSLPVLKPVVKDEARIEYEPGDLGLYVLAWDRRMAESYPEQTVQNIYFEWSKPWSRILRTKLTTNYRFNELEYTIARTEDAEMKTALETLVRLGSKSYFVVNLGASRRETVLGQINYSVIPGAGVNINLLKFLYLQLDYESNFMIDSTATHFLSTRITGQF
jgi:hypothetical protein